MSSASLRAAFGGLALMCAFGCSQEAMSQPPAPPTPPPAPQTFTQPSSQIAPDLPPLKANINAGAAPAEVVRTAYEFAGRHPEILKYMPCFCGCERLGHEGNDDCFVGGRDKNGKVTEWETHGLICEICIDVAQQTMQMHNMGMSLPDIRKAIEARYAKTPSHMPTPMPPARGAKGHHP